MKKRSNKLSRIKSLPQYKINRANNWLKTNYETNNNFNVKPTIFNTIPKKELYNKYLEFCDSIKQKPISISALGKIIILIFPNIKIHYLMYNKRQIPHYSGIKYNTKINTAPIFLKPSPFYEFNGIFIGAPIQNKFISNNNLNEISNEISNENIISFDTDTLTILKTLPYFELSHL